MKKYNSEVILLTKNDHIDELECWIEWHSNVVKFDHIVVLDNESTIDAKQICDKLNKTNNNKIEYCRIEGWPDQYKLYNDYINKSQSQWILTIDDDEYLYIGDKYNGNVNDFLSEMSIQYHTNKIYALWLNLMSKDEIQTKQDLYINTHTYYSFKALRLLSRIWRQDNGWGKCFSNTDYPHYYACCNGRSAGHIPCYIQGCNDTILVDGQKILKERLFGVNEINTDCFIAHYQFKTLDDWKIKCSRPLANTKMFSIRSKANVYSELYKHKELFQPFDALKNKWDNYLKTKQGGIHET